MAAYCNQNILCQSDCCNFYGQCTSNYNPNQYIPIYTTCYTYYDMQHTYQNNCNNCNGVDIATIIGSTVVVIILVKRRRQMKLQNTSNQIANKNGIATIDTSWHYFTPGMGKQNGQIMGYPAMDHYNQPPVYNQNSPNNYYTYSYQGAYSIPPVQNKPYFYPRQQGPIIMAS